MKDEEDRADYDLLSLANEKGKFGIALGLTLNQRGQFALERGIDEEWFTLVDISAIAEPVTCGVLLRIFRLTPEGATRLMILRRQFESAEK